MRRDLVIFVAVWSWARRCVPKVPVKPPRKSSWRPRRHGHSVSKSYGGPPDGPKSLAGMFKV